MEFDWIRNSIGSSECVSYSQCDSYTEQLPMQSILYFFTWYLAISVVEFSKSNFVWNWM